MLMLLVSYVSIKRYYIFQQKDVCKNATSNSSNEDAPVMTKLKSVKSKVNK